MPPETHHQPVLNSPPFVPAHARFDSGDDGCDDGGDYIHVDAADNENDDNSVVAVFLIAALAMVFLFMIVFVNMIATMVMMMVIVMMMALMRQ